MNGEDKKLIGEFIRRHHERLAHEIALKGFILNNNDVVKFGNDKLSEQDRQFAGIVARSHRTDIRKTFDYLKEISYGVWKNPANMNIVYLMVLLRIADCLQIEKTRTDPNLLKFKTFNSPVSLREHQTHLAINHLTFKNEDPELIFVTCDPKDAQMYFKIQNLIKGIQDEFDLSWAVLGETYGFLPNERPKIKFRRIISNLEYPTFLKKIDYVPKKIVLKVKNDVAKLLISPLYGNNPSYGVRELVQNATDACLEKAHTEVKLKRSYSPIVLVCVDTKNKEFLIKDNGKGMTINEIIDYYLSIGSSFRKSKEWAINYSSVARNGHFGIGVLASFLLGDEIKVITKAENDYMYSFKYTINTDFIEIKKENVLNQSDVVDINDNCNYIEALKKTINKGSSGTEIRISLSDQANDYFGKLPPTDMISWYNWFISDYPECLYFRNGQGISRVSLFTSFYEYEDYKNETLKKPLIRILKTNDVIIEWLPNVYFDSYFSTHIACNNIYITRKRNFWFYSLKYPIPSFNVIDKNNAFSLRLDRTDINYKILPFEDSFLDEVIKDLIAQLLIQSPTINSHSNKFFSYLLEENEYSIKCLLFSKKGWFPNIGYFIDRVDRFNDKKVIHIVNDRKMINSNFKKLLSDDYFLTLSYEYGSIESSIDYYRKLNTSTFALSMINTQLRHAKQKNIIIDLEYGKIFKFSKNTANDTPQLLFQDDFMKFKKTKLVFFETNLSSFKSNELKSDQSIN